VTQIGPGPGPGPGDGSAPFVPYIVIMHVDLEWHWYALYRKAYSRQSLWKCSAVTVEMIVVKVSTGRR